MRKETLIKLFLLVSSTCFGLHSKAQNTSYQTLYNDGTFIKSINTGLPVGVIDGQQGTTQTGAATYTIPIKVTPGINGMEPDLSITYNSQSGSGLLGYGWTLTGLSSVTLDSKNIYNDGAVNPIRINENTPFTLDGIRLIPISGNNGASGTTYAKEVEDYSLVTSNGTTANCSSCPQWFKVNTKDGNIIEYGNSTTSIINATEGSGIYPYIWRINKVTDKNGNYIEYVYENINGENRIKYINYTGNGATIPTNKISFNYSIRSDKNSFYFNTSNMFSSKTGNTINNNSLLDNIEITSGTILVKKYQLNYAFDGLYSVLQEVKEIGSDNSELNSTIFKYGNPTDINNNTNTVAPNYTNLISTSGSDNYSGDFDGDGYTDIFTAYYGIYTLYNGLTHKIYYNYKIFRKTPNTNDFQQVYTQNSMTTPPSYNGMIFLRITIPIYKIGDYNGDGRSDILIDNYSYVATTGPGAVTKDDMAILYNTSTSSTSLSFLNTPITSTDYLPYSDFFYRSYSPTISDRAYPPVIGDFDGDGATDIIHTLVTGVTYSVGGYNSSCNCYVVNTSGGTRKSFISFPAKGEFYKPIIDEVFFIGGGLINSTKDVTGTADFDGDGKDEIFLKNPLSVLSVSKNLSNQYQIIPRNVSINNSDEINPDNDRNIIGDFNGDGKADVLRKKNNTFYTYYSTGGGTDIMINNGGFNVVQFPLSTNTVNTFNSTTEYLNTRVLTADFNGDGKCDVVFQNLDVANNKTVYDIYYSSGLGYIYAGKKEINNSSKYTPDLLGDFDGDGSFEILNKSNDNHAYNGKAYLLVDFGNQRKERLLKKIIDGFGRKTEFDYKLLTEGGTFYQLGSYSSTFSTYDPTKLTQMPLYCISSIKRPDGIGGDITYTYSYVQARVNNQGKGFLGFNKIQEKDNITNFVSETEYNIPLLANFYSTLPYKTRVFPSGGGSDISNSTNQYIYVDLGNKRFFPYVHDVVSNDFVYGKKTQIHYDYDANGNITTIATDINDGYESASVTYSNYNTYLNSPYPNLPSSIFEYKLNSASSFTKSSAITYDANGRTTQVIEFNGLPNKLTTNYTYDNFGNIISTQQTGASSATTISLTNYTNFQSDGRSIKDIETLSLNEKITVTSTDTRWAQPTNIVNNRGTQTLQLTYDAFGRPTTVKPTVQSPANFNIQTSFAWTSGSVTNSIYFVTTTPLGMAPTKQYFDIYNRIVREEKAENGKTKFVVNTYDSKGDLINIKKNDADGGTIETVNTYDQYHRLLTSTPSIGPATSNTYTSSANGYTVTSSTTGNPTKATQIDAAGRSVSVTESGLTNSYTYNTQGDILKVSQVGKDLIVCTYDEYGNQKTLKDIDANPNTAGKENKYEYDAFGNLTKQTDAKGNKTELYYDGLGRLYSKVMTNGSNPGTQVSYTMNEYYALNVNGSGKLKKITHTNYADPSSNLTEDYTYDTYDRLTKNTRRFENTDFITEYGYGDYNRINSITYPSVTGINPVKINYTLTSDGFATNVSAVNAGITKSIFNTQPGNYNAFNQVKNYSLGNSLSSQTTYNKLGMPTEYYTLAYAWIIPYNMQKLNMTWDLNNGNLLQRTDASAVGSRPTTTESFSYDAFNRLTGSTIGSQTYSVNYNNIGNITNKFDAGTEYSYNSQKIHAVEKITSKTYDTPIVPYPSNNAPNERSDISYKDQSITYNEFNQPSLIIEGTEAGGTLIKKLKYIYDMDGNRIKSIYTEENATGTIDASKTVKRYYMGNYEFEKNNADALVRQLNYIYTPVGLSSILLKENGQSDAYFFTYTDHLGSILTVTDQNSVAVVNQSFDAWGRYRNPYDWSYTNVVAPANPALYRGFTGHEMMPQFDLINMNGRLYDPKVGRMLSPDNQVQNPFSTQGFNRYSYVWNNPLKYIDPSGEVTLPTLTNGSSFLRTVFFGGNANYMGVGNGGIPSDAITQSFSEGLSSTGGAFSTQGYSDVLSEGGLSASGLANVLTVASWIPQYIMGLIDVIKGEKLNNPQQEAAANANINLLNSASKGISTGNGVIIQNIDWNSATASNDGNEVQFNDPLKTHIPSGWADLPSSSKGNISTVNYELYIMPLPKLGISNKIARLLGFGENTITRSIFSYITPKIESQMLKRGWTRALIHKLVNTPFTTRVAVNKATGNAATAYFDKSGAYVIKDNITNEIIQISNKFDPKWIPDATIINPYMP